MTVLQVRSQAVENGREVVLMFFQFQQRGRERLEPARLHQRFTGQSHQAGEALRRHADDRLGCHARIGGWQDKGGLCLLDRRDAGLLLWWDRRLAGRSSREHGAHLIRQIGDRRFMRGGPRAGVLPGEFRQFGQDIRSTEQGVDVGG